MPTIVLQVDGRDTGSAVLARVRDSLIALERAFGTTSHSASAQAMSLSQVATAADRYATSQTRVATALAGYDAATRRALAAEQERVRLGATLGEQTAQYAGAAERATTALDRQAIAGLRVADAYRVEATALERLLAQERRQAEMPPVRTPTTTPTGGGGGGGGGRSVLRGGLMAGGAYMAAYGAYSAVTDSIGRDADYSRLLGSTAAQTGLTPAQTTALGNQVSGMAGSGAQPYSRGTLLAGAYSLASLGIGKNTGDFPGAVGQITDISAKMSAAAGAPDMSQAGDAITSLINDFKLNNKNVVANAGTVADQLQVAVKLGKAEMPQFAASVAVPAQLASQLHVSSSDLLGLMAAESAGGIANTDLAQPTYALLASSLRPTNVQRRAIAGLGLDYNAGFWGKYGVVGGAQRIESAMDDRGLSSSQKATTLTALFGNEAAQKAFSAAVNAGDLTGVTRQVRDSHGAVQTAYETSQMGAGAALVNSEAKLAEKFDELTTTALPLLAAAAGIAADALGVVAGKQGSNWWDNIGDAMDKLVAGAEQAPGQAGQTLSHLLNPADKAFMNRGLAQQEAAQDIIHGNQARQAATDAKAAAVAAAAPPGPNPHPTGGAGPGASLYVPWDYDYSAGRGGRTAPAAARAGHGLMGADWVNNFAGPGRGSAAGNDAEMARWSNNIKLGVLQGWGRDQMESALGLYTQAAKNNSGLSGSARSLDIAAETKIVAAYLHAQGVAATLPTFAAQNAGQGGLEAGYQNTVVRFGGKDTQLDELRQLRAENTRLREQVNKDNTEIIRLLGVIAKGGPTAKASPFSGAALDRRAR